MFSWVSNSLLEQSPRKALEIIIIIIIIIIIHGEIEVTLSRKCCSGTVQPAMSHITCLQSQQQ